MYFSVKPDATKVDDDNEYDEDRDPDSRVDGLIPELDQHGSGTNLRRYCDADGC